MDLSHGSHRDRVKSAVGAALFHAVLGYALITGLGFDVTGEVSERLKMFDVAPEPPPPPPPVETQAAEPKPKNPEGAAAPPNLKARPAPIVAPPPKVRLELPPPVAAAPVAGPGSAAMAGAAEMKGPGTGAGGVGAGTGSGGQGSGAGGGGGRPAIAVAARKLRGRLNRSDYPPVARQAEAVGTVIVRFTVQPDGRVSGCEVMESSGNAELDATTCGLIERRFLYRPALDPEGRPVAEVKGWRQDWWLAGQGRWRPTPPAPSSHRPDDLPPE